MIRRVLPAIVFVWLLALTSISLFQFAHSLGKGYLLPSIAGGCVILVLIAMTVEVARRLWTRPPSP